MRSMTGYGRFSLTENDRELMIELKSVNHRYLDLNFRLPRAMQFAELSLRKNLAKALSRGHVDVSLSYQNFSTEAKLVSVDKVLALSYYKASRKIKKETGIGGSLKLSALMNLPEVLLVGEGNEDEVVLMQLCLKTLDGAIAALLSSREYEGNALRDDLAMYLDQMESLHFQLADLVPRQPEEYRQRLTLRLEQLAPEGLDAWRLAQEVALFADKVAVDEELARLSAHMAQMKQLLQMDEPIGRKIDFLSQEMNREINTIGSKSNSLPITRLVLDMKNTLEKVREQVQNVE